MYLLEAEERARLENAGKQIDDFDLLIGATAVVNNFTLITHNTRHFERISSIQLEDWVNKLPPITAESSVSEKDI